MTEAAGRQAMPAASAAAPFWKYNVIDMAGKLEIEAGVPVAAAVAGDDRVVAGPGARPPVGVAQQPLLRTTNPARIICAGQLLARVFAAWVVAAHNGPA
jgi:hypothetical protein